jgi:hypothetical protein
LKIFGGFFTGKGEQLINQFRQGKQGRTGIEAKPVGADLCQFATGPGIGFKQGYPVTFYGQPDGNRQSCDTRSYYDCLFPQLQL